MPDDQSDLVLNFARVLFVNGQSTEDTISAANELGNKLGLQVEINPRWGELQLQDEDGGVTKSTIHGANPEGVHMGRVSSDLLAAEEIQNGKLSVSAAVKRIEEISRAPPVATWQFIIAAAAGASALSVLFGVQHASSVGLIAASAAIGAITRRALGRYSSNYLLQPFSAALVAGVIGGLAVQYNLSSSLRLIAICPCFVLIPGPHVLNGTMDLIKGRVHLGVARLSFAGMIVAAISAGLLIGLAVLNVTLPIDAASRGIPIWFDIAAAGVAVLAYSTFYSTPYRMFGWPVAVGMLSHALRYLTLTFVTPNLATGAIVASLAAGTVLAPVARRYNMPFPALAFASIVSMMPGVFLFRVASGLIQLATGSDPTLSLLGGTVSDGIIAITVILALTLGLIFPKVTVDRLAKYRAHRSTGRKVGHPVEATLKR